MDVFRKERDMTRELEKQQARVSQLAAAIDSTKEAQRIVLETKESVMRSLLKQNVSVSQEVCACMYTYVTYTIFGVMQLHMCICVNGNAI
jgi:hypothetical protein